MTKKIIISVLILIVVGSLTWYFLFYKKTQETDNNTTKTEENIDNKNEDPKLLYLSQRAVVAPVLAFDELSVWYFEKSTGKLLRQHTQNLTGIKDYPLPNHDLINYAIWPNSGSDFISITNDGKYLFSSINNEFIPYPPEANFLQWLPSAQRVAYIWSDDTGSYLSHARSDMADYKSIVKLPDFGFRMSVSPNGRTYMLFSGSGKYPIYFVIDTLGALESVTENVAVVFGKFSPDGKRFAYVTAKNELSILDLDTKKDTFICVLNSLNSFAWSNDSNYVYCGRQNGSITKKSLLSGLDTSVIDDQIRVSEFLVSKDETYLFFVQSETGFLGRIKLQ